MTRKILVGAILGATALAALGATPGWAQQPAAAGADRGMDRGWHASAEDAGAFLDARIAALKAGLRLSADQDKNWAPFEQAYRDLARMRMERRQARQEHGWDEHGRDAYARADGQPAGDPIARLATRAEALSTRGAALKRLADTAAPLYGSLDDAQKHRFVMLSHMMGPMHRMHGRGMDRHGMERHGMMEGHRMDGRGMGGHGMMEGRGMDGGHAYADD